MAEEEQQPQVSITIDQQQQAGVWANFAVVSHSAYEFTLDFVRLDYNQTPPSGVVVSRVSLAPLMVDQLITALQNNWKLFAQKSLPQEVFDRDPHGDDQD